MKKLLLTALAALGLCTVANAINVADIEEGKAYAIRTPGAGLYINWNEKNASNQPTLSLTPSAVYFTFPAADTSKTRVYVHSQSTKDAANNTYLTNGDNPWNVLIETSITNAKYWLLKQGTGDNAEYVQILNPKWADDQAATFGATKNKNNYNNGLGYRRNAYPAEGEFLQSNRPNEATGTNNQIFWEIVEFDSAEAVKYESIDLAAYNGKDVFLRNAGDHVSKDNYNSNSPSKITTTFVMNAEGFDSYNVNNGGSTESMLSVWTIEAQDNGNVLLKNPATGKYLNGLGLNTTGEEYYLEHIDGEEFCFLSQKTGLQDAANAYLQFMPGFTRGVRNTAESAWHVDIVTDATKTAFINAAKETINAIAVEEGDEDSSVDETLRRAAIAELDAMTPATINYARIHQLATQHYFISKPVSVGVTGLVFVKPNNGAAVGYDGNVNNIIMYWQTKAGIPNYQSVWVLECIDENNTTFTLKNAVHDVYLTGAFNTKGTAPQEYTYHADGTFSYGDNRTFVSNCTIIPVDQAAVNEWIDTEINGKGWKAFSADGHTIGEAIGEYHVDYIGTTKEEFETRMARFAELKNDCSTLSVADMNSINYCFTHSITAGAIINPVNRGQLIRIHNVQTADAPYYLGVDGETGSYTQNADQAIVYYNGEGHLINLTAGVAHHAAGTNTADKVSSAANEHADAAAFNFIGAGMAGAYNITYADFADAGHTHGYVGYNATTHAVASGFGNGAPLGAGSSYNTWNFYVSEVKALPVNILSDGFGAVVSPVALQVPANTVAYTAKVEGVKMSFNTLEAGSVIPAGAHALIATTDGSKRVELLVADSDETSSFDELKGDHLSKVVTPGEGKSIYIKPNTEVRLTADGDEEDIINTPLAKLIRLEPEDNGTVTVPGGVFAVEMATPKENPESITIDPVSAEVTLGIGELNADKVAEGVYDLQGRKLVAPVKGINIIGGRKVLVK